ncbi:MULTISPECIES: TetR/AcrR family transcriptional regulator [unclassified Kitasatospora]|uniref:TetR/AcrR family transcriptional regulator n=1 Tax=unclassified Kitasatospora TaxID=2633591 RepID=UPI000708D778|nr:MULTISPECIES: TetR/AcrR family transcriptional regulator [unclassified Kitasatospora]KQV21823.1 TetR family transcriptional regulator [Kitasatospora sp. Root107]KRB75385.1 TetR family transcriptional regulator [Kitasatospora sp. Root187]
MTDRTSADLWPAGGMGERTEAARRLLLAAVESFARRGYHATTTRDIATAAGMSPAALYIHYSSKSALLSEISRTGHQATLDLVERAAAADLPPVEQMRRLVEEFTCWHARGHTVGRIVNHELHALPEDDFAVVAELRRRIEETVRRIIEAGVATGAFEVQDVRTAARAVTSLGIDVSRWYTERSSETPEELGRRYGVLVLRMLGAAG